MPRKGSNLRIKVKDEGIKAGKRRISAEVIGDRKLFESSDTFAERGTISKLSDAVQEALTREVRSYFERGKEMMDLVDQVAKEQQKTTKKAANDSI